MNDIVFMTVGAVGNNFHGSLLSMVLEAGAMVQFVLLLLLVFSVVSWAIILMKYKVLKRVKKDNDGFLDAYMKGSKLSEIFPETKKYPDSTIAEVFRSGYTELIKVTKVIRESLMGREADAGDASSVEMNNIDNIERALNRARDSETTKLENALGFLATTGSASPFIGLFGTVWGIMDTFKGIGARGSATLAVVAPGISEALIATAAGLAAAIPAVIFYNYYINRVKAMSLEMDNFSSELLNIIERYYVRK
ncbi:MAG: Biopolymer transport protein ExbB [Syntrophaceae bacterium PtaB.Bin095]|nr:MAG: Biopolymer transport protein ExbB [Syntrophaceae bacterium PtaB.Bin095]